MRQIVIIGGGFVGSMCAKSLEKFEDKFSVTLIDCKPYFEFTCAILRTILEPAHEKKIQVMHEDYLKKTKVVPIKHRRLNGLRSLGRFENY